MTQFEQREPTVQAGMILIWNGAVADIPPGWAVCDGNNGTPDLLDRFVFSTANEGNGHGYPGGWNTIGLKNSQMPLHKHSITIDPVDDHSHTQDVGGSSTHESYLGVLGNLTDTGIETDNIGDHFHSLNTDTTGIGSQYENRPAFRRAFHIMRL